MKAKSQTQRVLEILAQGGWWSKLDFARLDRPILRLSARVFELRHREGYVIEQEVRKDGVHRYRLMETP